MIGIRDLAIGIALVLVATSLALGQVSPGQKSSPGTPRPEDRAALGKSIESGDVARVRELLTSNPTLANMKDADGWTPLDSIAFRMTFDVSLGSSASGTATSGLVKDARLEIASLLLDNGANPNPASDKDVAPLLGAVRGRHWALAKLLVEKGARRSSRSTGPRGSLVADDPLAIGPPGRQATELTVSPGPEIEDRGSCSR